MNTPSWHGLMDQHAQTFSTAAKHLSPKTREHVRTLYALARTADDLADEPSLGALAERRALLAALRADAAQPDGAGNLAQQCAHMLQAQGASLQVLDHLLASLEHDMSATQLTNRDALMQFAFGVAGTVGLLLRPLLGAPAQADVYAAALGMAMQLTNIARDVQEDAVRNRCYLPSQAAHAPAASDVLWVIDEADALYDLAERGLTLIAWRNRLAVRVALRGYQAIGHAVRAHIAAFGDWPRHRVMLSAAQRRRVLWQSFAQHCWAAVSAGSSAKPGAQARLQQLHVELIASLQKRITAAG
jgi:15-cis-phytoene synthase